jgi:hypothetical protein
MRVTLVATSLLALLAAAPAYSDVLTYDITACIDGESQLIIQQNTLQWLNISFRVPGDSVECAGRPSTFISSTFNGSPVLTNAVWTPTWAPGTLTNPFVSNVTSSVFTGLSPVLPATTSLATLTPIQARFALTIFQQPTTANGGTLILDFNDGPPGGAAIYEGLVTIDTNGTPPPPPVPEPSTYCVLGIATAGLVLRHAKRHGYFPGRPPLNR